MIEFSCKIIDKKDSNFSYISFEIFGVCCLSEVTISVTKDKNEFDHEWSHALNEYYEFLIFNPSADELFVLVLAYD